MKKISALFVISIFICGLVFLYACSKDNLPNNFLNNNFDVQSDAVTYDSITFISRIRSKVNPQCANGDSATIITIYRNTDGSVDYKYQTILATNSDSFRSYTPDIGFVQVNENLIEVELDTNNVYYKIPFHNPNIISRVSGTITFTCECCSGGGSCRVAGSCCPQSIGCESGSCGGECGLNAREASRENIHEEFILLRANSVSLRK